MRHSHKCSCGKGLACPTYSRLDFARRTLRLYRALVKQGKEPGDAAMSVLARIDLYLLDNDKRAVMGPEYWLNPFVFVKRRI